ncbi:MAG: hypothetical protein HYV24_08950 [Deltaproteobacteria bacterium]|nr:hypothetical protein [Deltaproteobacteria bacterium]
MTKVYLDNMQVDYEDTGKDSTIRDLVSVLDRELGSLKRFILELAVDGTDAPHGWRSGEVLLKRLSECTEIRLTTTSVDDMAKEGLETVREYINVIGETIKACAKDLRVGSASAAEASFATVFEGVIEVVKTIDALSQGTLRYNMALFRKRPEEYFGPIHQKLETITKIKKTGDTVLLADVLEYELKPLLEEIGEEVFH